MSVPRFAIVGHPNKGKSSLVATLAEDDAVRIAPESGTTARAARFPMRVGGETLYELIDTPGFQRPRRVLEWLREAAPSAAERSEAVRRFVAEHRGSDALQAECELLAPIVEGAGIIYVVDGAVPFGSEYEPEMEILRWSGRPSLAVINPIGARTHVDEWREALGQYFRIVREVDVLAAPLEQRLDLLRAFGELDPEWRPALDRAVEALRAERVRARARAARAVADLVADALTGAPEHVLAPGEDQAKARAALEETWRERLRALERHARERVEQAYHHDSLDRDEPALALVEADLFAERTWRLFGIERTAIATLGIGGGAATGLGVDALLGGASLLLGSAIGAVAGGAAAWLAADRLAEFERAELPFGEQVLRVRAGSSPNLPFVLLGRARLHHSLVARRSHARREPLVVEAAAAGALNPLDADQRRRFTEIFRRIAASDAESPGRAVDELEAAVLELIED